MIEKTSATSPAWDSGAADLSEENTALDASFGDADALGRLYDQYADKLHRYLMTRTRGNQSLADDIAGDTWLQVAANISSYQVDRGGFAGWLFTIAKNRIASHYRSATTRREYLYSALLSGEADEQDAVDTVDQVDPTAGPDQHMLAVEAREAIEAAVGSLPNSQRQVMILHHWGRLTLAETAAVVKKTPAAVAALHQRALRKLAPALQGYSPRNFDASILVAVSGFEEHAKPNHC